MILDGDIFALSLSPNGTHSPEYFTTLKIRPADDVHSPRYMHCYYSVSLLLFDLQLSPI